MRRGVWGLRREFECTEHPYTFSGEMALGLLAASGARHVEGDIFAHGFYGFIPHHPPGANFFNLPGLLKIYEAGHVYWQISILEFPDYILDAYLGSSLAGSAVHSFLEMGKRCPGGECWTELRVRGKDGCLLQRGMNQAVSCMQKVGLLGRHYVALASAAGTRLSDGGMVHGLWVV